MAMMDVAQTKHCSLPFFPQWTEIASEDSSLVADENASCDHGIGVDDEKTQLEFDDKVRAPSSPSSMNSLGIPPSAKKKIDDQVCSLWKLRKVSAVSPCQIATTKAMQSTQGVFDQC